MRARPRSRLALLALAAALAACGKREVDPCSNAGQRAWLAGLVESWYLYPDLLPRPIDPDRVEEPAALLAYLTDAARQAGKDRGWSYLGTVAEQQQFFGEGTFVGFGVTTLVRGSRLFVTQVFPGSAAAAAGFRRGDEVLALGAAEPLTPVATLIASDTVGEAFGPATVGLARTFEVVPRGAGASELRTMTKGTYGLDPVPPPVIVDRSAQQLPPAGYVLLRTFIAPAEPLLQSAFATLADAGVTDVVVDLRYNGGGLLQTANVLANLLLASQPGSVAYELLNNPAHAALDQRYRFDSPPPAGALTPARVAFLVSDASASASELVPNVLAPYVPTALVGHQTYGKPVGQRGFANACGTIAYVVAFELRNSAGYGGYFGGLPADGFAGCGVAADDDLAHDLGNPAEGQTAAALGWLASPACPALSGPLARAPAERELFPAAARPTEAQRHLPGLF